MKTLITAVILSISSLATAQTGAVCGEAKEIIQYLQDNYKERSIWIEKSDQGVNYAILGSADSKSWSMIQISDRVACLVLTGSEFIVVPSGTKIKTVQPE